MKRKLALLIFMVMGSALFAAGCGKAPTGESSSVSVETVSMSQIQTEEIPGFEISEYSGRAYDAINGNQPCFEDWEKVRVSYEQYSKLDSLGRCGPAMACIGPDMMPTEERKGIGQIKPAGWHLVKYDVVDGKYLYNRCHLIGYQLTGENANPRNLITGTRYMNMEGMLPIENQVSEYIKETGNHVLYRVTPIYQGNNLLADGVLMEACSVEDAGEGICLCMFAYNVQPGIEIDYATGESKLCSEDVETAIDNPAEKEVTYIMNKNTRKFHRPDCPSVTQMKPQNRREFTGSRNQMIAEGFSPCGRCEP